MLRFYSASECASPWLAMNMCRLEREREVDLGLATDVSRRMPESSFDERALKGPWSSCRWMRR